MEKQLPHVSILSLQAMALRKIVRLILVGNIRYSSRMLCDDQKQWIGTVESKVSDIILKLQLPESLAKEMKQIIKPIVLEIIRWKLYHESHLNAPNGFFDGPFLKKLQWTAAGAVDYGKTAEELVRCDVFEIVKRYELACLYCLDQYVPELWKELPQEIKIKYYNEEVASLVTIPPLHYCWPYILKGEEYKLDRITGDSISFYQFAFECSSSQGNKTAAQYFLQKLSSGERKVSLIKAANAVLRPRTRMTNSYPLFPDKNISDVLFYLLSEMTREQQVQIISAKPADVLGCFFDWPWQDAFLDSSDALWILIQCEDLQSREINYDILIRKLVDSIRKSDNCLPNLFQNFFTNSPSDFKNYFVKQRCSYNAIFMTLTAMQDTETVNVILSNLDAGDIQRLVLSKHMLIIFYFYISTGRGDLVEMFLREAGLSKEDKLSVKEGLRELMLKRDSGSSESITPVWRKIFEFLDETEARAEIKRSSDDETLSEAKRLHCEKLCQFYY